MQAPVVVMSKYSEYRYQHERTQADYVKIRRPATDKWVAKHSFQTSQQQRRKQETTGHKVESAY